MTRITKAARKSKRIPKPWFRKSKRAWYVWIDGKQVRLDKDYDRAVRAFEQLMTAEISRR